jgi:hypothetical protein
MKTARTQLLVPVYQTTRRHVSYYSNRETCSSFRVSSVLVLSNLFYHRTINSFDHSAWNVLTILFFVRFEVITVVTMKNAVFWDVAPCRSCVNRRFGGTYRLHLQSRKIRKRGTSVSRWLQTEPPVENIQLYKNRKGGWMGHMGNQ